MINFKEIPAANGNENQDKFELFARDFLQAMGYSIVSDPNRGPDGGIDIKIKDIRKGVGNTEVFLLVSCKHFAHSSNSVTAVVEVDILDRVSRHGCSGFIGFYSTIAHSSLTDKLSDLKTQSQIKEFECFDSSKIESHLLKVVDGRTLFHRYFPESYIKWIETERQDLVSNISKEIQSTGITKDDLLDAALTAKIITEIIDLKEQYYKADWEEREDLIGKLDRYIDYSNIRISKEIFSFLARISSATRGGFTVDMALAVDSLIVNFFPYSEDEKDREVIDQIAIDCAHISVNIVYDAAIHLRNLAIAEWPLSTLKYIHRYAKQYKSKKVLEVIVERYDFLQSTLARPERSDLGPAQQLVGIFRADLDEPGMTFPVLPLDLYNLIQEDEKTGKI